MRRSSNRLLLSRTRLASSRRALARNQAALKQSRTQAAQVQQRFDSLFADNPDAVYSLDRSGRFVAANQACETLTGYSTTDLLSMSAITLIPDDQREWVHTHFLNALTGEAQTYELALQHKSGTRV